LTAFARPRDRVAITDLAARGVHEIRAALHLADQLVVEEVLGLRMQRGVDRHYVALAALSSLAEAGTIPSATVADAISRYGIDADKPDPTTV
jgi:pyruvate dehydrogenase complex dehydrogenase (E1) component